MPQLDELSWRRKQNSLNRKNKWSPNRSLTCRRKLKSSKRPNCRLRFWQRTCKCRTNIRPATSALTEQDYPLRRATQESLSQRECSSTSRSPDQSCLSWRKRCRERTRALTCSGLTLSPFSTSHETRPSFLNCFFTNPLSALPPLINALRESQADNQSTACAVQAAKDDFSH